jgi:hypothetical protein
LLAGRKNAAFGVAKFVEVEGVEDSPEAGGKIVYAIEERENAKVLVYGEIAGERSVNGGEVGGGKSPGTLAEKIEGINVNGAGSGFEYAEDHADGGGLSGAVDAQQTYDFSGANVERDALDGLDGTVVLAEIFYAKDWIMQGWRGFGLHSGSDAIIRLAGAEMPSIAECAHVACNGSVRQRCNFLALAMIRRDGQHSTTPVGANYRGNRSEDSFGRTLRHELQYCR